MIYTLTLNPAYDIHATVENLQLLHENLAHVTSRDAGGKGVNISRALSANSINNRALVVLGEENGAEFENALKKEGIDALYLRKKGRIRENLTIHERDGETRISFSGFSVGNGIFDEIEALLNLQKGDILTFTGSLPNGVAMNAVKSFLASCRKKGVFLVIDSRSFSLDDLFEVKPLLIKPNSEEISAYMGKEATSLSDCINFAKACVQNGIENAMVSLGAKGALLATKGGVLIATPPKIEAISTIGAGDSSIAGFLAAYECGVPASDCLKNAVAYGSAACLTEGTQAPRKEDIIKIAKEIKIEAKSL